MRCDIGVVIVTYNRLNKLKRTLSSYSSQKLLPKYILVVNNASTDGTDAFLSEWKLQNNQHDIVAKYVINLSENRGGSGGFYIGQEKAVSLDANWIMLADDDAYPSRDYIEGMQLFIEEHKNENISAVCGKVDQHGVFANEHRGRLNNLWSVSQYRKILSDEDYKRKVVDVDWISYVGIVVSKKSLKKAGLVNKDYFIWCDDMEHCMRLKTVGRLICIPQYAMVHDCDLAHMELSWKTYYGWRNRIDMFRRHFFPQFVFTTAIFFLKTCCLPLKGNRWAEMKLRFTAMRDGILGRLGVNRIYKPGWKP
ncbi:MAG: glycosyltransferase [Succiniclasticum sp.]|nr:glycosyltransferase [Selenomonadales bacterium]MDY2869433.1 glycosyltransferase [Succiniclasticum sp.]